MSKIPDLSQLYQMHLNASINTELYSQNVVSGWMVLHYLGNTLSFTMSILFVLYLWCTKWTLLIHNGVKTHQGCEGTWELFWPLQSSWLDATDELVDG